MSRDQGADRGMIRANPTKRAERAQRGKSDQAPEIVLIAAIAEKNRVIGRDGELPWYIPEDLKHFKRLTTGETVLMGRVTFESIVESFGGVLPDRRMVVLTSRGTLPGFPDVETYPSIDEALEALKDEERIFIGGGGRIYEQFLERADRLELTLVEGDHEGDTCFPPWEHLVGPVFELVVEDAREGFRFVTYGRK